MKTASRTQWIDWLRGLAVVFMIEIHTYDAWLIEAARNDDNGKAWFWAMHLGGFAAPLFLFLAGLMVGFRPLAAGAVARRGLEVIGYGYLFRLVLIAFEGFRNIHTLAKVDILQQIGFSLVLSAPLLGTVRQTLWRAVAALAFLMLAMPIVTSLGAAPPFIQPVTDYFTGARPMSYFPAFPWAAYTFGGIATGAALRESGERSTRIVAALFVGGLTVGLLARQQLHPWVVAQFGQQDPNHGIDGVVRMLYRLGMCVALVAVAQGAIRLLPNLWTPLCQMGRTSLMIYVVHVPLVYGPLLRRPLKKQLSMLHATLAVAMVLGAMLIVSLLWQRWKAKASRRRG